MNFYLKVSNSALIFFFAPLAHSRFSKTSFVNAAKSHYGAVFALWAPVIAVGFATHIHVENATSIMVDMKY